MEEIDAMPMSEFRSWQYAEQREPFGDRRLDHVVGILASVIANIHRPPNSRMLKPSEFMSDWDGFLKQLNEPEDPFAQFQRFADAHNKEIASRDQIN